MSGAFRSEEESLANRLGVLREEHARLSDALRERPERTPRWTMVLLAVMGASVVVGPLTIGCESCVAAYDHDRAERDLQRKELCKELTGRSQP
jgi:hypothetical protein